MPPQAVTMAVLGKANIPASSLALPLNLGCGADLGKNFARKRIAGETIDSGGNAHVGNRRLHFDCLRIAFVAIVQRRSNALDQILDRKSVV